MCFPSTDQPATTTTRPTSTAAVNTYENWQFVKDLEVVMFGSTFLVEGIFPPVHNSCTLISSLIYKIVTKLL